MIGGEPICEEFTLMLIQRSDCGQAIRAASSQHSSKSSHMFTRYSSVRPGAYLTQQSYHWSDLKQQPWSLLAIPSVSHDCSALLGPAAHLQHQTRRCSSRRRRRDCEHISVYSRRRRFYLCGRCLSGLAPRDKTPANVRSSRSSWSFPGLGEVPACAVLERAQLSM